MAKSIHRVTVEIADAETLPGNIRLLTLRDREDWDLPPFTAGAHIDVHLPSGKVRQYSLCGDPLVANRYIVAVGLEDAGRGGSREVHETLSVGQELLVSLPRNLFPLAPEGRVVMVAGGIGLTPFLSMLPGLIASGRDFHLHICGRSAVSHGLAERVPGMTSDRLTYHVSEDGSRLDLSDLIVGLGKDDRLYVCGPARMMAAAQAAGANLGDRLSLEQFGSGDVGAGAAYEVELAASGRVIAVREGETMLEALRADGLEIPSSCEGGVCLECKTRYLAGSPVHKDLLMSPAERATHLTPCVSGCSSARITLDL